MKLCILTISLLMSASTLPAEEQPRPYSLRSVDLSQRILWGAEVREPEGRGLAFGGQDQQSADGRPHTRLLKNGEWVAIHEDLRKRNPLQPTHDAVVKFLHQFKPLSAQIRFLYFEGISEEEEARLRREEVLPLAKELTVHLARLTTGLPAPGKDQYSSAQSSFAFGQLNQARQLMRNVESAITPQLITNLAQVEIHLQLAAEACDAEPPARALNCGLPRREKSSEDRPARSLVYDPQTKLYVLFGGDHFDYLTNDTWVFDPQAVRWFQRHPEGAPPPRANHRLEPVGDGLLKLTGGYTYTSSTDYLGGQYIDLNDGEWLYDIEKNEWLSATGNSNALVSPNSRVYRTGALHPDYYLQGDRPNAAEFQAWLAELPVNEWVATNPKFRPSLNRDWGTARIDPHRDLILRWSGGHSAHGGTDVPHFHFATNRWELAFPVEFPLGQLYANTEYPSGYNFNLRPWMTGHTYQNYEYDLLSRKMIQTGHRQHYYLYDPDLADWVGRGEKPQAMQYDGSFFTLTLTSTPQGTACWDANGNVHFYRNGEWEKWELTGDPLPGAPVDYSTICHDSQRDRLLIFRAPGYAQDYQGEIWSVDCKTHEVKSLAPAGRNQGSQFANIDKCCYDPVNDLVLLGTYLKGSGDLAPIPAYDCAQNRWITLDLKYDFHRRNGEVRRDFPHQRSDGLMFDPKRKLFWGVDTHGQVYVLKLDLEKANPQPLAE